MQYIHIMHVHSPLIVTLTSATVLPTLLDALQEYCPLCFLAIEGIFSTNPVMLTLLLLLVTSALL